MVLRRLGGLKPGTALAVVGEPALLIYNAGFLASRAATASRLVWQVTLAAGEDFRPTFFLSASDGSLVAWDDGVREIDRAIYDCSDFVGDLTCYLNLDGSNHIYGRSEGLPPRGPNPFNAPFAGSTDVDKLYDLAGEIHNYYAVKFGRNGGNGQGGTGNGVGVPISQTRFVAHANLGANGSGICNRPQGGGALVSTASTIRMCYGSVVDDVVAHEYAHRVSQTTSQLVYSGEAGALDESNSDIFGEMFEYYKTGATDWSLGTHDIGGLCRSIPDPHSVLGPTASPERYYDPIFYCGTADNSGVHINSTVPSRAAYFAAVGGSFNGCTMQAIGMAKVEQIWCRALTTYYSPSETFNGACQHLRQACLDLYPAADCAELTKALQAVELDQPDRCSGLPAQPASCAPPAVLRVEQTPVGPRWFWGAECANWTLQVSYDLSNPHGWTDVQAITAPGEYVPQASAPQTFCRLKYVR